MFKSRNVEFYSKLICFALFMLTIFFTKSFITLFVLAIFFYLFSNGLTNNKRLVYLYLITIILIILSYGSDQIYLAKIILIIDYGYYFIKNIDLKELLPKNNINIEEETTESVRAKETKLLEKELKKGTNLKQEEIDQIKDNLAMKIENVLTRKKILQYLRFGNHQSSINKLDNSDDYHLLYFLVHIFVIVLAVMVG